MKLIIGQPNSTNFLQEDSRLSASTIHASNSGSDTNGDGTSGNPYETIERVFKEISVRGNYKYTIKLSAGSFDFPNACQNIGAMSFVDIVGATMTIASSHTINSLTPASPVESDGLRINVTGSPFGNVIGKLVKFTSGALNGQYGVIYDNGGSHIYVTQSGNTWTAPSAGDTFDIMNQVTAINLPDTGEYVYAANSKINFQDLLIDGDSNSTTFSGQFSVLKFTRCLCSLDTLSSGNGSFIQAETSYFDTSSSVVSTTNESATLLAYGGTVINGLTSSYILARHLCSIRLRGEVVFANLDSNGIELHGAYISCDRNDAVLRLYNCAAGFRTRDASSVELAGNSYVKLAGLYGDVSSNYMISAALGDEFYLNPAKTVVSTGLIDNSCSADYGSTESYYNYVDDTYIYGSGNEGSIQIGIDVTSLSVESGKSKDVCVLKTNDSNTGTITITNFTGAHHGQKIVVIGASSSNHHQITDGGNFELEGGATWTGSTDAQIELIWDNEDSVWRERSRRAA